MIPAMPHETLEKHLIQVYSSLLEDQKKKSNRIQPSFGVFTVLPQKTAMPKSARKRSLILFRIMEWLRTQIDAVRGASATNLSDSEVKKTQIPTQAEPSRTSSESRRRPSISSAPSTSHAHHRVSSVVEVSSNASLNVEKKKKHRATASANAPFVQTRNAESSATSKRRPSIPKTNTQIKTADLQVHPRDIKCALCFDPKIHFEDASVGRLFRQWYTAFQNASPDKPASMHVSQSFF